MGTNDNLPVFGHEFAVETTAHFARLMGALECRSTARAAKALDDLKELGVLVSIRQPGMPMDARGVGDARGREGDQSHGC